MEKVRVLCILPTMNLCGGMENFYMSYYKNFSKDISVDFITHENTSKEYKKMIEDRNDNLYIMPKIGLKNIKLFKRKLKEFFLEHHDYDAIHCNMANAAVFYFKEAKKYNINVRILHSHQNKYADKISHKIRNIPLVFLGKRLTTHNMACTKAAGEFLFKHEKYTVINNAIDVNKFKYNKNIRTDFRKKEGLEDTFVIGNVGRFTKQKNQKFLLDVLKKICEKKENTMLLLIGEGELEQELMDYAKKIEVDKKVRFIKPRNDIENYYQIMDVFVLPSFYEGLGIVNIEAQTSGLHVFVSQNVPDEIAITDLVTFISLNETPEDWANKIINTNINMRHDYSIEITKNNYNIYEQAKKLEKYYKDAIKENRYGK